MDPARLCRRRQWYGAAPGSTDASTGWRSNAAWARHACAHVQRAGGRATSPSATLLHGAHARSSCARWQRRGGRRRWMQLAEGGVPMHLYVSAAPTQIGQLAVLSDKTCGRPRRSPAYALQVTQDTLEDAELDTRAAAETLPATVDAYRNHPLCVRGRRCAQSRVGSCGNVRGRPGHADTPSSAT